MCNNLPLKSRSRPCHKNWRPKNFHICSVFRGLRHLMANIFWTKRDIENRTSRWKVRGSSTSSENFVNLVVHERVKIGPQCCGHKLRITQNVRYAHAYNQQHTDTTIYPLEAQHNNAGQNQQQLGLCGVPKIVTKHPLGILQLKLSPEKPFYWIT